MPPTFDFFPEDEFCLKDKNHLNILKTDTRTKKTMKIGSFRARETIKVCPKCGIQYRSKAILFGTFIAQIFFSNAIDNLLKL